MAEGNTTTSAALVDSNLTYPLNSDALATSGTDSDSRQVEDARVDAVGAVGDDVDAFDGGGIVVAVVADMSVADVA